MKYSTATIVTGALTLCVCCNSDEPQQVSAAARTTETVPEGDVPTPHAATAPSLSAAAAGAISGTVVETMDAGGYTYVLVDTGAEQVWAAGPVVVATVGSRVSFDGSMSMANYTSPTMERTFDKIYFTGAIELDEPAAPDHDLVVVAEEEASVGLLDKAEGGVTVAEVFGKRADLIGTEIVMRGEVVKFTPQILDKNWLHIQDGTGDEGTNDLTLTTDATAAVGDIVLVRGVLVADKDFGYGYEYELIIEDAEVTVE